MAHPTDSALSHWRPLLVAIAPAVAVATVVQSLLTASAGILVADGWFVTEPGWQDAAIAVVWLLAWTLSLAAAMIVMRGVMVDAPVGVRFAVRAALRRWGVQLLAIVLIGLFAVLIVAAGLAMQSVLGPLVVLFVIAAFVLAAVSVAVLPLAVLAPDHPFVAVSRAWELGVGRRWYMIGLGLCVCVPGAAIAWAQPRIGPWSSGPVNLFFLSLGLSLLSVLVIGYQASILARWYVKQTTGEHYFGSRPRPARWWLGLLPLAAAAAAVAVVGSVNLWGVPVLVSSRVQYADSPLALAANGGAVLPDGRVLTAYHSGADQEIHFEICGGRPYCDTKIVKTFEQPGVPWQHRAAVAVGEGLNVVAVVQQRGEPSDQAKLVVWHCPTIACDQTTRTVFGSLTAAFMYNDRYYVPLDGLMFALDVDDSGHPLIAWGTRGTFASATLVRCDDAACTRFTEQSLPTTEKFGGQPMDLSGLGFDARHRAVTVFSRHEKTPRRSGLRISVADPSSTATVVTLTCRSADCGDRLVQRWTIPEAAYYEVMRPMPQADGSPALVTLGWPSVVRYLIRCESHCA